MSVRRVANKKRNKQHRQRQIWSIYTKCLVACQEDALVDRLLRCLRDIKHAGNRRVDIQSRLICTTTVRDSNERSYFLRTKAISNITKEISNNNI